MENLREQVTESLEDSFDWSEIEKGVNKIYSLSSESRNLILKVESENQVDNGVKYEPGIYEMISQETNVPSPNIIYTNLKADKAFYIMENLPGDEAGEVWPQTTFEQRKQIIHQYGEIMGKIHAFKEFERHGDLRLEEGELKSVNGSKSWEDRLYEKIGDWQNMIEDEWKSELPERLNKEKIKQKLQNNPKPVLIHEDNRLDNLIIQDSQITGFLDWSSPESGSKKYDLARAEYLLIEGDTTFQDQEINSQKQKDILEQEIIEGYRKTNEIDQNWRNSTEKQLYRYSAVLSISAEFKEWGRNLPKQEYRQTKEKLLRRLEKEQPKELLN